MRHLKAGRKFKRSPSHRRMMLRNLATALLEHGKITTTLAKAKELQPYTEKLISLACRGIKRQATVDPARLPLAEFRRILAVVTKKDIAYRLFLDFQHEGVVRTAALTLDVPAGAPGGAAHDEGASDGGH